MSIKFTQPTNLTHLPLGETITFQGTSDNEVVKIELLADNQYKLGEARVFEGIWTLNYPFNSAGKRHIIANGFDTNQKQVSSDAIDILLVGARTNELGIDVSNYNGEINWQAVKNSDISFAFTKATEGETYVDELFTKNWQNMKSIGLIRGAYHFFRPLKDPNLQAENFLRQIQDTLEASDLPAVLDVEHYPEKVELEWQQISLSQRIDCIQQWLNKVESATERKPIIYTSPGFWSQYMENSQAFTNYPLWLAHYTTQPEPTVPANNWGGKGWTFWQHTETGSVAGVNGQVDRNRFNSSFDKLVAFVKNSSIA